MKAYILAGGEGTRMQPITQLIPKCLIPIKGKPFIIYEIEFLSKYFDDISILIEEWMKPYYEFQLREYDVNLISFDKMYGTSGKILTLAPDKDFLVTCGDSFVETDFEDVFKTWKSKNKDILLILANKMPVEYGIVYVDKDNVVEFSEKPYLNYNIWSGMMIMKPEILKYFDLTLDISQILPKLINKVRVGAYISNGNFYDIGTFSAYKKTEKLLEV